MVWRKTWIETRWRFVLAVMLLLALAALALSPWPTVLRQSRWLREVFLTSAMVENRKYAPAPLTFHQFAMQWWFDTLYPLLWLPIAVLLGTGSVVSARREGGLFTLTLPITRDRILLTRIGVGVAELAALALIGALVGPVTAWLFGEVFSVPEALGYGVKVFLGGLGVFGMTLFLAILFQNPWASGLAGLAISLELALAMIRVGPRHEDYFSLWLYVADGPRPWAGQLLSLASAVIFLVAARWVLTRRSF